MIPLSGLAPGVDILRHPPAARESRSGFGGAGGHLPRWETKYLNPIYISLREGGIDSLRKYL